MAISERKNYYWRDDIEKECYDYYNSHNNQICSSQMRREIVAKHLTGHTEKCDICLKEIPARQIYCFTTEDLCPSCKQKRNEV